MKKTNAIILLLFLLMISFAFYSKNNVVKFYDSFFGGQKIDWQKTINNIEKNIIAPSPLKIGGIANQVILTKGKIIAQTNIARFDNGMLPPLLENEILSAAALKKAQDMFSKQYFEHISPTGVGPGELAKSEGYEYVIEGENLILGNFKSEEEAVSLWMASPGHRANILNDRFTEIGVAIIKGTYEGQTVWIGVQEFGLPLSSCPQVNTNLKNKIDADKNAINQISAELDIKKSQINATNQNSQKYNILVDEFNKLAGEYNLLNKESKSVILEYNNQINAFNECIAGN